MFDPRRRQTLALLTAAASLPGCAARRLTSHRAEAMRLLTDRSPSCHPRANTLLAFLPGVYDTPEDLVREGFVAALRARRLPVDVVLVDAHVGYYTDESIEHRLHDEIVTPARAAGYRSIWLAGISLGGLGCLAYAQAYPRGVDGLILLAPYLGNRGLLQEIETAGGLAAWHARAARSTGEERVWHWIADLPAYRDALPVYLGFGDADRFVASHRLLAGQLPASHVISHAGGHDWPVWHSLWAGFLDHRELTARFADCALPGDRP